MTALLQIISGLKQKFLPRKLIFADEGFDWFHWMELNQGELEIPAFIKGKKQLNSVEERHKMYSNFFTHAERRVLMVRQKFGILKDSPGSTYRQP